VHANQGFILDNQNQALGIFGFDDIYSGITVSNLRAAHSFPEHLLPTRVIGDHGQAQSL
jgi:hypothetical protein